MPKYLLEVERGETRTSVKVPADTIERAYELASEAGWTVCSGRVLELSPTMQKAVPVALGVGMAWIGIVLALAVVAGIVAIFLSMR